MTPRRTRPSSSRNTTAARRGKVFLAVAGNIGAGKSSLTQLLSQRMEWKPFFESVEDNPYLGDFYADMKRWSFNLQVYFLSNRFRSHKAISEGPDSVILDRVIYEDAEIFARNLRVQGYMDERDWATYRDLSTLMFEQLTPPDLLVYVRRSTDELMERIRYRGRDYEADIPRTYVAQLNDRYDEFFEGYRYSKRLVVEADGVDYLEDPAALAEFGRQIHAKLEQTDLFIQA